MDELEIDACIDNPDERDYHYNEYFGAEPASPKARVDNIRTSIQDQSIVRDPSTTYACTCFSLSHCINENNAIAEEVEITTGESIWVVALTNGAEVNKGWSLQEALNMAKDKYIAGYTKVWNESEAIDALDRGQLIYTGSNQINWKETRENNNIVVRGKGYGHCFSIFGYIMKDQLFICKNSYGPDRYDKGYFYIKFSDFDILFTKYALIDKAGEKAFTEKRIRALQAKYPTKFPSGENRSKINDLMSQKKYQEAYTLLKHCLLDIATYDA